MVKLAGALFAFTVLAPHADAQSGPGCSSVYGGCGGRFLYESLPGPFTHDNGTTIVERRSEIRTVIEQLATDSPREEDPSCARLRTIGAKCKLAFRGKSEAAPDQR
jgi:hypothetical protein